MCGVYGGCCSAGCNRQECSCQSLGLGHPEPRLFYTSQWNGPPVIYVMYRVIVALYFFVWLVLTGTENGRYALDEAGRVKWFIFLTNWTNLVLTFTVLVQAITATYCYLTVIRKGRAASSTMPWYLKFEWAWYNLAINSAFLLTILYWGLLHSSKALPIEEIMFHTHATNSIFVLLDLFITAMPLRLLHFYYGVIYTIVYAVFSVIYTLLGGTNHRDEPYIYGMLDWNKSPGVAAIYTAGSAFVGMPVVWLVQYGLYRLRVCVAIRCCHKVTEVKRDKENLSQEDQVTHM